MRSAGGVDVCPGAGTLGKGRVKGLVSVYQSRGFYPGACGVTVTADDARRLAVTLVKAADLADERLVREEGRAS
jgi:hypothetical protein